QIGHQPVPFSDALSRGPNLWLGSLGGGIYRVVDDDVRAATPTEGLSGSYVFALAEARETSIALYYAENRQLRALAARADGGGESRNFNADIGSYALSVVRDDSGDLWISTATRG